MPYAGSQTSRDELSAPLVAQHAQPRHSAHIQYLGPILRTTNTLTAPQNLNQEPPMYTTRRIRMQRPRAAPNTNRREQRIARLRRKIYKDEVRRY